MNRADMKDFEAIRDSLRKSREAEGRGRARAKASAAKARGDLELLIDELKEEGVSDAELPFYISAMLGRRLARAGRAEPHSECTLSDDFPRGW